MFTPFVDLHTHTTLSDGRLPPKELVLQAREAGIRILAITDHNYTEDLDELRNAFPDMTLIQGAEVSCLYSDSAGLEYELHVVGLGFNPKDEVMQKVLAHNRPDRRPYINAILAKLRDNGIDLGTYDSIKARFPNTKYIGRMALARCLYEDGYTSSVDQSFDLYLGAHGEQRAYVKNNLRYVSLEQAVSAIMHAGGIPVLAHLLYYKMNDADNELLVRYFKELTGDRGAMEVYYSRYDTEKRLYCLQLCQKYDLLPSAASDYHAQEKWESLQNRFSYTSCSELLNLLGIKVAHAVPPSPVLVLSGPSGTGKGTVTKEIIKTGRTVAGSPISIVVSDTTRDPRGPGDNYNFLSRNEYDNKVSNHQYLEHNGSYSKNGYGTPISGVQAAIASGTLPCLEIDRVGLCRLLTDGKVNPKSIRSVFIVAPAGEVASRLISRGTEPIDVILRRLRASMEEVKYAYLYHAIVENDTIENAVTSVIRAFEGEAVSINFNPDRYITEMEAVISSLENEVSL